MQAMLTGILSETESEFDRVARDMRFYAQLEEEQNMIESYVNESIILASGNKRAINEMVILHEAALGDKIKGFFTKIKNFFKKIFDKLGAALNGLIGEQKKYIEKYANIITKCKYVATDVQDVKDHFKGLPRILDAVDNTERAIIGPNLDKYFTGDVAPTSDGTEIKTSDQYPYDDAAKLIDAAKNLPQKIDLNAIRDKAFTEFTTANGGYWSQMGDFSKENKDGGEGVDVDKSFRNYFDGSADTVTWTTDQIDDNFQTIINTTYAGDSYLKRLDKINSGINAKMDKASSSLESYYEQQKKKIQDGINSMATGNTGVAAEGEKPQITEVDNGDGTKSYTFDIKGHSYKFGSREEAQKKLDSMKDQYTSSKTESYSYLNEINGVDSGSGSNSSNGSNARVPAGTGRENIDSANKAGKTVSDLKQTSTIKAKDSTTAGVNADNKNSTLDAANKLLDIDIYNRQARINADVQISSSIARAIYDSFKQTNADFYWIIQKHVQWYLGNPGAESKTENQRAKVSSLNMNAGSEKVNVKAPAAAGA